VLGGWKSVLDAARAQIYICRLTEDTVASFASRNQNLDASSITPFWYDYTMALNIKDPETEQLAADVASLAGESKTAAIRQALRERRQRLLLARDGRGRGDRMVDVLEASLWPKLPAGVRSTPVARAQREAILGYGPEGV
jgi:antitoxin VapB